MALHEQSVGATDEWYTPPHVFDALGCVFDLDVASLGLGPSKIPRIPAAGWLSHGALDREWRGFVWMNPPFGHNGLLPWIGKFIEPSDGICVVPHQRRAHRRTDGPRAVGGDDQGRSSGYRSTRTSCGAG